MEKEDLRITRGDLRIRVPADHSQVYATTRLHLGRECTKAQVTPHWIRREGKLSVGRAPPSGIF